MDQLGTLRNPAALPGWLATTTRRECGRLLRAARVPQATGYELDAQTLPDEQAITAEQQLLTAERHAALREALLDLPPECQRLIALLAADPPEPYAEISARLGIPVGSIGPTQGHGKVAFMQPEAALACAAGRGDGDGWPLLCCPGRPGARD